MLSLGRRHIPCFVLGASSVPRTSWWPPLDEVLLRQGQDTWMFPLVDLSAFETPCVDVSVGGHSKVPLERTCSSPLRRGSHLGLTLHWEPITVLQIFTWNCSLYSNRCKCYTMTGWEVWRGGDSTDGDSSQDARPARQQGTGWHRHWTRLPGV